MYHIFIKVLKAQHWQLFIIFVLVPLILHKIFAIVFLIWIWSIVGLQVRVPSKIRMNDNLFKASVIFFILCSVSSVIIMDFMMGETIGGSLNLSLEKFPLLFSLNMFGIICGIYCIYFVAKTFKMIELQRKVKFSDYILEFLLFWFYPIGIWILQPRINRLIENQDL